jgi:hypothetical protein
MMTLRWHVFAHPIAVTSGSLGCMCVCVCVGGGGRSQWPPEIVPTTKEPTDPKKEDAPDDKARKMRKLDERAAQSWPPHKFVMDVQGVVRSARGMLEALSSADVVPDAKSKSVVAPSVPRFVGVGSSRPTPKTKAPSIDGPLSAFVSLCKGAAQLAAR